MNFDPGFFQLALGDNAAATALRIDDLVQKQATQHSAGGSVVACRALDLDEYQRLGHCRLEADATPRPDHHLHWGGEDCDRLVDSYSQVCWRVAWRDQTLCVLHAEWATGCGNESRDWVLADEDDTAMAFILDVERKTHAPGEAILVFSDGFWQRSHALYQATRAASFEDLILADDLKQTIRDDFRRFLDSEAQYRRLGVAWRRGALLIGPPGNGKTHCVRAMVKELGVASLYVQSLAHPYYEAEQLWKIVFQRARGLRPCVLVLEDLDSLVTDENRSFFLNQLDGFEQNHGLIVLATTNYPERIDGAIIDRPSRFDRKYRFALPTEAERRAFLGRWQARLADETGWRPEDVAPMASATRGFSFAYLKELMISAVMQWVADPSPGFAEVARNQAKALGQQVSTEATADGRGWFGRRPRTEATRAEGSPA